MTGDNDGPPGGVGGSWHRLIDRVRRRPVALGLLVAPVLLAAWGGWARRWMSDDGFINVRIVEQILAGNGPVFNAGERIEAATSPLWIAVVTVGSLVVPTASTGWVAVGAGLGLTTLAVALAGWAGWKTFPTAPNGTRPLVWLPVGTLAYLALPPARDFITSGLELGLSLAWLAGCQAAIVHLRSTATWRSATVAAFVIGLGPLVRPDFVVFTVAYLLALVFVAPRGRLRLWVRPALAFSAAPVGYQVFRMMFYASVLPNTAIAKEATGANWSQGFRYITDLADPYGLWVIVLLVPVALWALLRDATASSALVVALTPVLAAAVYAGFIVRGGGDFMHGRLLLPAIFAFLLPLAAVPVVPPRRTGRGTILVATALVMMVWSIVPLHVGGPPYRLQGGQGIADERSFWPFLEFEGEPDVERLRPVLETPGRNLIIAYGTDITVLPLHPDVPGDMVLAVGSLGKRGILVGRDVYVVDMLGLADPLAARFELEHRQGRPGHEKKLSLDWVVARYAAPDAALPDGASAAGVEAARKALECPAIQELFARVSRPLSLRTSLENVVSAAVDHQFRVPADPSAASACSFGNLRSARSAG